MSTTAHSPNNTIERIDEMFAFVSVDAQGNEGVCAFMAGDIWMPLVGADMNRVAKLRECAKDIAHRSGKTLRLVRFTKREEMEVIEP